MNILFGITFPIFDWACHLGGSIAGILYGFALVTKHSWKVKLLLHVASNIDSIVEEKALKKKFLEKHNIYYFGIFLINISFSFSILQIEKYQKIAGLAAYSAAQNNTYP